MCWRAGSSATPQTLERDRTDQSFCVPKGDIECNDYDLSINRYKEVVHAESRAPAAEGDSGQAGVAGG
jgi:hypothetical protein